jgi:hypothetical protein
MPAHLKDLTVDEVSLVDRPANSSVVDGKKIAHARIALWKRDSSGDLVEISKGAKGVKFVIGFPKSGDGGSKVQSVIFDKESWTIDAAKDWLKSNDFSSLQVDETGESFRFRQEDPEKFARFRTIAPGEAKKQDPTGGGDPPSNIPNSGVTPMTLEAIEKKLTEQDAVIAALKSDNDVLKAENELVLKMSKQERMLYASMSEETRKAYMAGDVAKRGALMEEAKKAARIKELEDGMDEATKARYAKAGPAERKEILEACDKAAKPFEGEETEEEEEAEEEMAEKAKKNDNQVLVLKVAASEDRVAKAEERLAKAEAELAAVRKRERVIKFAKRAEDELPHTPGTPEQKGERLMKMADVYGEDTPEFNEMLGVLKAADRALSIQFHEVGKAGGAVPAEKVWNAKVEEIAKRDRLDVGHATRKAMEEAPELYLDYEQQHRQMVASR